MTNLNIEERQIGDVTVLDMDGNIRIGGSNIALAKAISALVAEGRKRVVLNLARVAYVDSSGLGELISGHVALSNSGGEIKLLNLTKRLKELMTMTKLLTIFDVYDDEAKAIDSFNLGNAVAVPSAPIGM